MIDYNLEGFVLEHNFHGTEFKAGAWLDNCACGYNVWLGYCLKATHCLSLD